jgi:hypothetical protein
MSRYLFENNRYAITIGWDSPLNTFFATVFDNERESEFFEPLIWLGTQVGEYPDVHQFLSTLSQKMSENDIINITFPDNLTETLESDHKREGEGFKKRPTEIQNFVLKSRNLGHQ